MSCNQRTRRSGQSIVETVVGIIFLVPIVLFLLDIAVLVMTNTANDNLAKTAARAAASAHDGSGEGSSEAAYSAAQTTANTMAESAIITKPSGGGSFLTGFCWNEDGNLETKGAWPSGASQPSQGNVAVVTTMTVKVPVPFPFLPSQVDFVAKACEPVVSVAAGDPFVLAQGGAFSSKRNNKTNGKGNGLTNTSGFNGGATGGLTGASSSSSSSGGGVF